MLDTRASTQTSHAYRCDPADPSERCLICGQLRRSEAHRAFGFATPVPTQLFARPERTGGWTVGLMTVAADGTRRLGEIARAATTAEAQRWLDAHRAIGVAA